MLSFEIEKWDGKVITRPCIVSGMPLDHYHSAKVCDGPSISSSGLRKIFMDSPAHYWATSPYNPEFAAEDDEEPEDHFKFGTAAHHLLLGEDDFSNLYIVRPEKASDGTAWNSNKLICIAWLEAQAKAGRIVLTQNDIKHIRGMARSLAAEPLVRNGCLNGLVETSIFWKDKATGIWLKSRPDAIPDDSMDVVDLKSTAKSGEDLDWEVFLNRRYDMQGELVRRGLREVAGLEVESFTLLFVGKTPPYGVEAVAIDLPDLDSAGDDLMIALRTFKHCLENNYWFGPGGTQNDARFLHKPPKAENRILWRRAVLEREIKPRDLG